MQFDWDLQVNEFNFFEPDFYNIFFSLKSKSDDTLFLFSWGQDILFEFFFWKG